jgi:hypothetical protein
VSESTYAVQKKTWRPNASSRVSVMLSRSEACAMADAVKPLVDRYGSRKAAAVELKLTESAIQKAVSRKTSLTITRSLLNDIMRITGLDTTRFGS